MSVKLIDVIATGIRKNYPDATVGYSGDVVETIDHKRLI